MKQRILDWHPCLKSAFWLFRSIMCQVVVKRALTHPCAYDNTWRKKAEYFRFVLLKIHLLDITFVLICSV